MSAEVEEDAELRDLVAHTLETNGVLGKLRAQLRASVFLALDEQDPVKHKAPFRNQEFKKFASSSDGQQILHVVREFLQFFNLEYSLAVFDAETDCSEPIVRTTLMKQLELTESTETSQQPIISEVIRRFRNEQNDKQQTNSTQSKPMADVDQEEDSVKQTSAANFKKTISHEDSTDNDDDDDDFFIDSNRSVKDDKKSKALAGSLTPPLNSSIGGLSTLPDKKLLRNEDSDGDNEYEADFQLSNVTPLGQTPRSARSDARTIETEEVSEEIEEDLGDLIRSDASQITELTTDRTVSPADLLDKIGKADYLEDVLNSQS